MAQTGNQNPPEQLVALWRGFLGTCPNCGKGRLFKSYLKQNEFCPACNADFSGIHADDGPGWFVMILTGAIVVPVAISLSLHDVMPDWAVLVLLSILTIAVALLILPRAKGIFIAILWQLANKDSRNPSS